MRQKLERIRKTIQALRPRASLFGLGDFLTDIDALLVELVEAVERLKGGKRDA